MNKNVLITGASRGIGKAIAYAFASKGYHLILTCHHNIEELKEYALQLEEKFLINCNVCQLELGDYDAVANLFDSITDLDILINNVGISHIGLLQDMTIEEWDLIMHTNLYSCFYTSKLAIPLFLQNHTGKIINISSIWGNVGASLEVAYSTTKGGINAFTKALAKELAPSNIQVNAIACGIIDTDMTAHLTAQERQSIIDEIPVNRLGTPEEIALLALQLIEGPDYLTGQIITIDGGWY